MSNKLKNRFRTLTVLILSICAWVLIWDLTSYLFDFKVIFPGPADTIRTLIKLLAELSFWKSVMYSFLRIFTGLLLGVLFGIIITLISRALPFLNHFIYIGMSVIKSTPVASIVLILWIIIDGNSNLPSLIAVMMVAPIVWQNLNDGFNSISKQLLEVAKVFEFSKIKSITVVYIPTLFQHFIPAVLSSVGLAWKAGISAEVIAYTKNSIGKSIADAKSYFEGDVLFAWTLVVVLISITLEYAVKFLLRRYNKNVKA